jgi:uncharacterized protein (DUF302 family)
MRSRPLRARQRQPIGPGVWRPSGASLGRKTQGHHSHKRRAQPDRGRDMTIEDVALERFSVVSSKPFKVVIATLKAAIGQPDVIGFIRATKSARMKAEATPRGLEEDALIIFMELDQGDILRRETGLETPKTMRLLIGNPLVMKEMVRHVPDAGSYAPVTVLVDERPDGVHLSYDRMTSLLAGYRNAAALAVARDLDSRIERLLHACAS